MIRRTLSGTSISSISMSARNWPVGIEDFALFNQMPVDLFDKERISLALLKDEAQKTFRSLALA